MALILGVRFFRGVEFLGITETPSLGDGLWTVQVNAKSHAPKREENSPILPNLEPFKCNVLVGADGQYSKVANYFNFERKVLKGSQAIGITANFENKGTVEETKLHEFGLMSIYNQKFFHELNQKYKIHLENLVYYREATHYLGKILFCV